MALIKCKACDKAISKNATACPHCGEPVKTQHSAITQVGGALIAIVIIFIALSPMITRCAEKTEAKNAQAAASAAGFRSVTEQQQANAKGFTTKAQQDAHAEAERATRSKQNAIDKAKKDAECEANFSCYAQSLSLKATVACQPLIEAEAPYDYEWIDGFWGAKLTSFRKGPANQYIIYSGDQIKVQAANGTWMRHSYTCHYNTAIGRAISVTLAPGRI